MTQQSSPFIDGKFGWNLGESGWNSGMDENLLKFSYLLDKNIDGVVSTLPAPTTGQAYFLTTDSRVYYSVNSFWYSSPVPKWFSFSVKTTGKKYLFNGTSLLLQRSQTEINTELDNLGSSINNLGTAAFKDESYFATTGQINTRFAELSNNTNTALGANLVGFEGDTLYNSLQLFKLPSKNIIYADDPRFGGNIENAVAALGSNQTLVIRQPYTTLKPLRIVGKTNTIVCCVGAGSLNGSRTAFTFPDANARGILSFDNCTNSGAYQCNIKGSLTAKSTFGADVRQDGDAGVEHYQCTSPRTIECKIDQVLSWAVINIQCTDTKTNGNTLTRMTRQSGIGHASVVGGECVGNTVMYSGLYGIEVEGLGNKDIKVHDNVVSYCLKGIAVIGQINSCEIYDNTVAFCTFDIQLDANGSTNTQVGVVIRDNRTYDAVFHIFINDATFVDIYGNTSLIRNGTAYVPSRAEDQVVSVISPTEVLILDSSAGPIAVGDVHSYAGGPNRTVQAVSTQSDPVYGLCWRVTYTTANSTIAFGSFFMRNTVLTAASTAWIYLAGTRNNNVNIWGNSCNGQFGRGLDVNGNQNGLRYRNNGVVGALISFYAGDAIGITNSSIVCKRGDLQAPGTSLFGGAASQKLFPAMVGEVRTAPMLSANRPIVFATNGSSQAFRLRLNLQGSTKTANTGNAQISLNGVTVATIPVAQLGGALIKIDVAVSVTSDTYTINLADTFGDMGFASAVFELHTIES